MTKLPRRKTARPSSQVQPDAHVVQKRTNRRWLTVALLIVVILLAGLLGVRSLLNEVNIPQSARPHGGAPTSVHITDAVGASAEVWQGVLLTHGSRRG